MKKLQEKDGMILIEFPEKTGKEIVDECNNKVGEGKLVYSTGWYGKEDFYTTEKSRPGKRWISKELVMMGMSWNACDKSLKEEGEEMLDFAETLWFLKTYVEHFKKYPDSYNWSWTSSRSAGGRLGYVGSFDSGGVSVYRGYPDYSYSGLGVRFSRSDSAVGAKAGQAVADSLNLESAIKMVKEKGYKIFKEI